MPRQSSLGQFRRPGSWVVTTRADGKPKESTLKKAQRELDNVKDILVKFPVPVLSGNIRKPKKLKVPPNNAPEGIK